MRLIFAAAAAKVATGLAVVPWIGRAEPLPAEALPTWYYIALLVIFGVAGLWLYLGGRSDVRARLLGMVLLLFGTLFTERLIERAIPSFPGPVGVGLSMLAAFHLTAFEPFVFWHFAWRFPRTQSPLVPAWFPRFMSHFAFTTALVLILGNLIVWVLGRAEEPVYAWLSPTTDDGWFWQIISILLLPSLGLLVAKRRAANASEQRRLSWVVAGILVGVFPMVVHVLLVTIVQRYALFVEEPTRSRLIGIALTAISLVIPASAAYAVVVDQVLEVRFVLRRAVQYALARYTVIGFLVSLVLVVASVGYGNRNRPLSEILGNSPGPAIALLMAGILLVGRRFALEAIDRHFFREQYDAHRILVELVDKIQNARTTTDVVRLITAEVDRALHLECVSLLVRDPESNQLRDLEGRVRSLDADGALGLLILGSHAPLNVDLSRDSPLSRLQDLEREWLADALARLIVPLFGANDRPFGVLVLGDKRSELPFTPEDRKLMMTVAASVTLSLEQKLQSESPDPNPPVVGTQFARQCVICGRVQDRQRSVCHSCGNVLRDALLPAVLAGKFEIERQIGAGGMGVVYRARDLTLDRSVAIKVLPRVAPQSAARLRREARAMAVMQHPNLAVVHAMESWRGAPVLVLEYLSGGTLAERIRLGSLPAADVVALGLVIADVLHYVHRAGYLHRDVKPSNIAYTDRGIAKLLDFGLARFVESLSDESSLTDTPTTVDGSLDSERSAVLRSWGTGFHRVVGTPAYLSPEAVAMGSPSQSMDLWGLAVTLYEALTGRNPFSAPTFTETFSLIRNASVRDPREVRPDCPPEFAAFFASALAIDPNRRPHTAADVVNSLQAVSTELGVSSRL